MHFSKILVTTDFSDASYQAFDLAAYDAKMAAAEVRLLNVYQYFHAMVASPDIPTPAMGSEFYEECRRGLQDKLNALATKHFHGQNVITDVVLSLNSPADTICWYAKEHGSEVIVISSTGHTALKGLFFGSTVQRVLLLAPCPVLVVPVRK